MPVESVYINDFNSRHIHPYTKVAVKDSLADGDWEDVPHLYCDSLTRRVNAYDEASLSYEFGASFKQPDSGFQVVRPLDLLGKFVRIRPYFAKVGEDEYYAWEWVGYVTGETTVRGPAVDANGARELTGRGQKMLAVGLEYFLDRRNIDTAPVWNAVTGQVDIIKRPLVFNNGTTTQHKTDVDRRANREQFRSEWVSNSTDPPELWRGIDIVENLIAYQAASFPVPLDFTSNGLSAITPTIDTANKTTFEVLNELCHVARGFTWWLEYEDFLHKAFLRIDTTTRDPLDLPGSGKTLPANEQQIELDFDELRSVGDVIVSRNMSGKYGQVIARGARQTSTFTVGYADETLTKDWTTDEEDAYKTAAAGEDGYAALEDEEKAKANDAFRAQDRFNRVYGAFRIPLDWNGRSGDGSLAVVPAPALPIFSSSGSVLGESAMTISGMRLLNQTNLKAGWNYTDPSAPVSVTPEGTEPEMLRPFALLQVGEIPADSGPPPVEAQPRFQYCHSLTRSQTTKTEAEPPIKTNYHLAMQDSNLGILLRATHGLNHTMADGVFDADAYPSRKPTEVDYRTLRATIAAEADAYCEGAYPTVNIVPEDEILVIQLSDNYRLDYIAPKTIFAVENGVPLTSDGGFLRDDRKLLEDVAKLAFTWYATERKQLTVSTRYILRHSTSFRGLSVMLGDLITTIGGDEALLPINTVVGQVAYDFLAGTTTFSTIGEALEIGAFG